MVKFKRFRLHKRKVFTPRGKLDKPTYDIKLGTNTVTRAVSFKRGQKIIKKLNRTTKG
jgi:hypothetical protein